MNQPSEMSLQAHRPLITTITTPTDKMTQVASWCQEVASCPDDSPGPTSTGGHEHDDGTTVSIQTYYEAISDYYQEKEDRITAEERLAEVTRQLTLAKKKLADERLRLKMERKRGDAHFRKTILLEAVARSLTEENKELKKEVENLKTDVSRGTCCMISYGGGDCVEGTCSSCCECCIFPACRLPCSEPCPVPSVMADDEEERDSVGGGHDDEGEGSRGTFGDGDDDDDDDKDKIGNEHNNGVEDDNGEHGAVISGSDDTPDEEVVSNHENQDQHSINEPQIGETANLRDNSVCGGCSSEESEQVVFPIGGYDMPSDTWDDDLRPLTPADLARDNTPRFAGADWDRDYGIMGSFRVGCL